MRRLAVMERQLLASQIDGVSKVLCADDDAYGHGLAEPIADL